MVAVSDPFGPAPPQPKMPPSVIFNANRPFIFVIYNEQEEDAAFAGIINAPEQLEIVPE